MSLLHQKILELWNKTPLRVRKQAKLFFFHSGLLSIGRLCFRRRAGSVHILMYHRIDNRSEFFPGIPKNVFEKQIKYVATNYHVISLDDLVEYLTNNNKKIPKNAIVITFDDGYRDVYTTAYPILKRYGLPATVFVVVDSVKQNVPLWTDRLRYIIAQTKLSKFEAPIQSSGHYQLGTYKERLEVIGYLKEFLKGYSHKEKEEIIEDLADKLEVDLKRFLRGNHMLSWEEVRSLSNDGFTIGSHTLTHPILTAISYEEAKHEIIESKKQIEAKIGKPVRFFCYPNGDFDENIKQIFIGSSLECACTDIKGSNTKQTDLYELARISTSQDDLAVFATRLFLL